MAREGGKPCVPHSANLSMVTVFTLHMMGAIPNAGPHVEFSIEQTGWTDELLIDPLVAVDGKVAIPEGPDWGVAVPEAWLQKADRQISES